MSDLGVPREEVRFAVVLSGGVSFAVWMGGPLTELDRLMRRIGADGAPPRRLVCTARADVKVGTSSDGINGATLALSQVNEFCQSVEPALPVGRPAASRSRSGAGWHRGRRPQAPPDWRTGRSGRPTTELTDWTAAT
jgi:hypothetical protein